MIFTDNAYYYYLNTYAKSAATRYDTHKKSELRTVYNNIVKTNKEAPLYKIRRDKQIPTFLIDIKENARQMKNVISSLSDSGEGLKSSFQKKVALSSDEDIVSASYISGSDTEDSLSFDIEVRSLAAPQSNLGNFLDSRAQDFKPGDYSFDLITTTNAYEFQYIVNPDDANIDVQRKLSRLFNNASVGLAAEIITDDKGRSALKLTSKQTGLSENETLLFDIKPKASTESMEAAELLGIHHVTDPAQNASFIFNGEEHSSYSNSFTVNNAFELTLKGVSPEGSPSRIGFKTSIDAVADNLQNLVDAYNGFIETGERYSNGRQGNRLLRDLKSVASSYRSSLESIGIMAEQNGSLAIDKDVLADTIDSKEANDVFSVLDAFKNSLSVKANHVSIDPIQYVDKIIVTYKNPGQNFPSPYHSSLYSGLMLDHFC